MTDTNHSHREAAAQLLEAAARFAEQDTRGRFTATRSLWARLHNTDDPVVMSTAFRALADHLGVSDISAYLGNVLRRMSAAERAAACRAAAQQTLAAHAPQSGG